MNTQLKISNKGLLHAVELIPRDQADNYQKDFLSTPDFARIINLDWENLPKQLREKLETMNKFGYLDGALKMNNLAKAIFNVAEIQESLRNNPDALKHLKHAIILSDLGKCGLLEMNGDQSEFVAKIFSINNIKNRDSTTLETLVRENSSRFDKDQNWIDRMFTSLERFGIDKNKSVLVFHNLHTLFSLENIKDVPAISKEVYLMVAHHHEYDDVHVENSELSLLDKILMLIDKYDAQRTRSRKSHEEAIAWISSKLENYLREDPELQKVLEILDKHAKEADGYKN